MLGTRGHRALLEYSPEGRLKLSHKSEAPCRDHLGAASAALQGYDNYYSVPVSTCVSSVIRRAAVLNTARYLKLQSMN